MFFKKKPDAGPQDAYELFNQKGLFVLGCARSGTTILYDVLRASPEAFLAGEYNCHLMGHTATAGRIDAMLSDTANFRLRRESQEFMAGKRMQEPFVPETLGSDWQGYFLNEAEGRAYIGDKIAVGPLYYDGVAEARLLERFVDRIPNASFVLSLRRPGETLYSMKRMFPNFGIDQLLRTYLQTFEVILKVILNYKNNTISFHEDLDNSVIQEMSRIFKINSGLNQNNINSHSKATSISDDHFGEIIIDQAQRQIFDMAATLYKDVRQAVKRQEHSVFSAVDDRNALEKLYKKLAAFNAAQYP